MKRSKNQGFGYLPKNQTHVAKIFQTCFLWSLRTMENFHALFVDFLNAKSPIRLKAVKMLKNQHLTVKKYMQLSSELKKTNCVCGIF
ncbi:hypothetical protein ACF3OE_09160 [Capnocytophaga canis]|uniref:hypothetical protein n=1 Tax=Capnocytophaga canis TaxID=1848903 RepID=UPI000BB17CA6|nr:hypothetical protein CGC52_06370 [Capnocytophaga sp. H2931]